MVCKDWEKGKKIFIGVCAVIIIIMVALGISIIVFSKTEKEITNIALENGNISDLEDNEEKEIEFTGPNYKTSKVYDEDSKEITLEEFSNNPMALLFFDSSNKFAVSALEVLSNSMKDYLGKVNVVVICVSEEATKKVDEIKQLIENDETDFNVVYDKDNLAKQEYKIENIPTIVFINKEKQIINTISANIDEDIVTANLDILTENY